MTSSISNEPFERLIISLRRDGLSAESDRLNDLIHKVAWTTGSEMIGELGLAVRKIKKEHPKGLSEESKMNIRECLKGVRRIWPRFF